MAKSKAEKEVEAKAAAAEAQETEVKEEVAEVQETEAKEEVKSASTREVKFNKNVKFGDTPYELGDKVEVNDEDYKSLLEAGVIDEE